MTGEPFAAKRTDRNDSDVKCTLRVVPASSRRLCSTSASSLAMDQL